MARKIDLDRIQLVEIEGCGLLLVVRKDEEGKILVRVESNEGGRRIIIKQHEEDVRTIIYHLDTNQPPDPDNRGLSLVK